MLEFLRSEQRMASAVHGRRARRVVVIEEARRWARVVVAAEAEGRGDFDNAIRRVGEGLDVGYAAIWGLLYRRPKSVAADVYLALRDAYEAACLRQLDCLGRDIDETEAVCGPDAPAVRAAKALVRASER